MIKRREWTETIRHRVVDVQCDNPNCYCIKHSFYHAQATGSFKITGLEAVSMIENGFIPISKTKVICHSCFLIDFYSDKKYTDKAIKYLYSIYKDNPFTEKLHWYIEDLSSYGKVIQRKGIYFGISEIV